MIRTGSRYVAVLCLLGVVFAAGCVSQGDYDDLQRLYRASQNQIAELQARLAEQNRRIEQMQNIGRSEADMLSRLEQAIAERDRLAQALREAQERLAQAPSVISINALEPELDRALQELAEANPNLISYDPNLGMLRFRSDLTFALGSADLNPNAQQSLEQLARILRQPVAAGYEVKIVGHTDNVPISRPETRAKHPTNWHLSTHRAISVKDALEAAGLQPVRLQAAGHGEHRPVVSNAQRGGAEANRRVEIFLLPMNYQGPSGAAPAPAPAGGNARQNNGNTASPAAEPPDVNK